MGLFDKWTKGEKPNYGLLEDFINKEKIPGKYSYSGPSYTQLFEDKNIPHESFPGGKWGSRGIYQIPTDDGERYYFGEGDETFDRNTSGELARLDAIQRHLMFPGDSLTTEQFNQFQNYGLYE